jgi:SAM-dependent methyltransferase
LASTRARISSRKPKPGPRRRSSRSPSKSATLPFADAAFEVTRAERLLVYVPDTKRALEEMRRVTCPGGVVTAIEPDFGTNAIKLADRDLVRRILDHECDANVPPGWLVRDMRGLMEEVSLRDVSINTRIVIFTPELAAAYFTETGRRAQRAGLIDQAAAGIEDLQKCGRLFCSIGYYLFTARSHPVVYPFRKPP